jgi:hypothetical protein
VKAELEKEGKEFGEKELQDARARGAIMFSSNPIASRAMFVNCWHTSRHESAAMWKLYTSENHSICVRSDYQTLWDCLPSVECYLGEVRYIDYDNEFFDVGNVFNHVLHKRASFSHEQEVRAVVMDPAGFNKLADMRRQIVVNVDLKALIQDVYVGPTAPALLLEVVQKLLDQAGFKIKVKQSGLNAPPAY